MRTATSIPVTQAQQVQLAALAAQSDDQITGEPPEIRDAAGAGTGWSVSRDASGRHNRGGRHMGDTPKVGIALAAAIARGEHHCAASARTLRVRIVTDWGDDSGLTINARIAARTNEELRAQDGKGTRWIPWAELDARASELITLVDEVVAEVEAAVKNAPAPSARPSKSESDLDLDDFAAFTDASYKAITEAAAALLKTALGQRLSPGSACEATMCAALKLAALAAHGGRINLEDIHDELKQAVGEIRQTAKDGVSPLVKPRFDA